MLVMALQSLPVGEKFLCLGVAYKKISPTLIEELATGEKMTLTSEEMLWPVPEHILNFLSDASVLPEELQLDLVEEFVNSKHGIKGIEIASEPQIVLLVDDLPQLLNKLVAANRIVELEYVTPDMNYRTKSIYFPKGTELNWKKS
jgi:hypothetical protein